MVGPPKKTKILLYLVQRWQGFLPAKTTEAGSQLPSSWEISGKYIPENQNRYLHTRYHTKMGGWWSERRQCAYIYYMAVWSNTIRSGIADSSRTIPGSIPRATVSFIVLLFCVAPFFVAVAVVHPAGGNIYRGQFGGLRSERNQVGMGSGWRGYYQGGKR